LLLNMPTSRMMRKHGGGREPVQESKDPGLWCDIILVLEDILSPFITLLFHLKFIVLIAKKVRVLFINVCASHFLYFVNIFLMFVLFCHLAFSLEIHVFHCKNMFFATGQNFIPPMIFPTTQYK
jgi:hypothetical protein